MIVTAIDMYNATLDGLNKEKTGTVFPDEWEVLINESQMNYIKNAYAKVEGTEKRIDDLKEITILDEIINNTGANVAGQEIFSLPYSSTGFVTTTKNPSGTNHGYLFMLRCGFKIAYVGNKCFSGTSAKYLKSKPMRADKRGEIERDPFNKPTDERLYHELSGNNIVLFTGTSSYGVQASIDYLRYPRKIEIVNTPVDCELSIHARQEIVDMAIRRKLEQIESRRYPTNINENKSVVI